MKILLFSLSSYYYFYYFYYCPYYCYHYYHFDHYYHYYHRIAPSVTRNSPMKPLVPGRPELAMANSMKNAANTGILLTTPP